MYWKEENQKQYAEIAQKYIYCMRERREQIEGTTHAASLSSDTTKVAHWSAVGADRLA